MIYAKTHAQNRPKIVVDPKSAAGEELLRDSGASQERVRERAYELYESRGREPGQDRQDWLRAEREVLNPKR